MGTCIDGSTGINCGATSSTGFRTALCQFRQCQEAVDRGGALEYEKGRL